MGTVGDGWRWGALGAGLYTFVSSLCMIVYVWDISFGTHGL